MANSFSYTPLHLSSCYSFGFGLLRPDLICREMRALGYRSVGLVDRHNFYGLVRFLRAARREGIKPIVGMTLLSGEKPLCTAYVLKWRGFVRLNQIVSLPTGSDPLQVLAEQGWEGLALMSEDPSVLRSLLTAGSDGLYMQLNYGRPFGRQLEFCRSNGLRPLAVNPAVFLKPPENRIGDLLRAIRRRSTLDELPAEIRVGPELRLASWPEMERFFSAVPEALKAALDLAGRAGCDGLLPQACVFPSYRGLSEEQSFRLLRRLCFRGAALRYGREDPSLPGEPEWRRRLAHELGVIRRRGFSGYFLVVRDILRRSSRTCGRGSSAASLVSYLLGITHVDPLRYNLDFDRFLNDERQDPPDIDVDFPWDERGMILRRLFRRNPGKAAMVADHVTFGPRSAVREAAMAFGLPEREIDKMVRFYKYGDRERIPPYLLEAARSIQGLPRHLGTHCGGVVITPGPITEYTHVQPSPLGYPVMAWDRESAEEAGLVKIDLLGNRSLAVLRDTVRLVSSGPAAEADASLQKELRLLDSPSTPEQLKLMTDPPTRSMVARGDTLGLFYLESPATRQLLRKMGRGDFEDLITAGSIIRPAASRVVREFLRRLHGAPYRSASPVLDRSFGLMIYQEDIARVTAAAAGFSPGLADRLRKSLAGNNAAAAVQIFRRRFFRGGVERGTPRQALEELWEMICSFRGYSFCRAHSASYALVSSKLAYLKRHYPLQFFLSVINNGGGYYSRQTYLNECRRLGIAILPADVNSSEMAYTVEGGAIRVGLGQLKWISREFLRRLLTARARNGPFSDWTDFSRRLSPGLLESRLLVRSGSLDGLAHGLGRPQLLWNLLRRDRGTGLFPTETPKLADCPEELKLLEELRTQGLMISRHPVSLFRSRAASLARKLQFPPLIRSSEIPGHLGAEVSLVGLVAGGKEALTRGRVPEAGGEPMVFISLEDETSLFETVLFPAVFSRYRECIDGGGVLVVCGRVEQELGAWSLTVRRLSRLF